jgi:hypothetical protein
MFCKSLFVLLLLAIGLSVLWFTVFDYPFFIFKLFFNFNKLINVSSDDWLTIRVYKTCLSLHYGTGWGSIHRYVNVLDDVQVHCIQHISHLYIHRNVRVVWIQIFVKIISHYCYYLNSFLWFIIIYTIYSFTINN